MLWVAINDPNRLPVVDAATQSIFDQGHLVGNLAHQLYPDGINLHTENIQENLKETQACLSLRKPLFEAGFSDNNLYCRVDILNPVGKDEWDIIEVKSTNEVKEEHLHDVAFQQHCCQLAGLKIQHCHIMHLNRDYHKRGEINPSQLFVAEDVTDRLGKITYGLKERISNMLAIMSSDDCPEVNIGQHCNAPYSCLLQEECWAYLPEHHVLTLYYGKKLGEDILRQGIFDISHITEGVALNDKQQIQKECVVCGKPYINTKEIQSFISRLEYPLHFLDFETFATAIPIYDGTRPYQNIPFQFSLHVLRKPDVEPEHFSYLAESNNDPRPKLLAALKKTVRPKGSILVYYEAFEKSRLKELAIDFPEYKEWIDSILGRIVDLIVPFKSFSYYHPKQVGSASLKKVLPVLTNLSYNDLEISEGNMASLKFMEAAFGEISDEERRKIRSNLLAYCGQDTGGMVVIVNKLRQMTEA